MKRISDHLFTRRKGETAMGRGAALGNGFRRLIGSLALALLGSTVGWGFDEPEGVERGANFKQLALHDVHGKTYRPFEDESVKACVLIFVSPDCPIANAFQPELAEIQRSLGGKEIRFFLIYCSPELPLKAVQEHVREFKITMPAILDIDQALGRLVEAKVTPEAIALNRDGEVLYRGMINNLYVGYGKKRPRATEHYLKDACRRIGLGETPEPSTTRPIGCFIYYPKIVEPKDGNR